MRPTATVPTLDSLLASHNMSPCKTDNYMEEDMSFTRTIGRRASAGGRRESIGSVSAVDMSITQCYASALGDAGTPFISLFLTASSLISI